MVKRLHLNKNGGIMKRLAFIFIPLLLSCVSKGNVSEPDETYPIEVSIRVYGGVDSLLFSGEYGNNSDTTEVSGTVPEGNENYIEYISSIEDTADAVFAKIRKEQELGQLKVSIYVNDYLEEWGATSNSYDSVYVSWKP